MSHYPSNLKQASAHLIKYSAWYLQGDFLYTVLYVSFDESVLSATRITSLYSFTSVITGVVLGFLVMKLRQLKPFIVSGTVLFMVAFGILIYFRGGSSGSSHSGVIGAQVLLGLGRLDTIQHVGT